MKTVFSFFAAVFLVLILAFLFLIYKPGTFSSAEFDDARTSQRCAAFEQRDAEDGELRSLGYKGRIRQLLHGCF